MTLLYTDPRFLQHETGYHPERADRIRFAMERFGQSGFESRCVRPDWSPVSRQRLARVHAQEYIDEVRALAESGGGDVEGETVVSPASYDVALLAAGSVCDATERILRGEDRQALCVVRPPGHHAMVDRAMGFCLFNNVAVAAEVATGELGLDRVLIVDWDVHHGNGTQATFWEDPRVGFFSIHRWPFYPGSGLHDETGGGAGLGATLNVPVEFGIPRRDYLKMFHTALENFADRIRPQLILLSAGFDTHHLDPVGSLGLETGDFETLTRAVQAVAQTHAGGRLMSVLEGGYHADVMADCLEIHLATLLEKDKK